MLSRLKKYSEKKQLLGFISNADAENFDFYVVHSVTEEKVATIRYSTEKVQTLIDELSAMKNVFKAVIVDLFNLNLQDKPPYDYSYKYCEELRKIFRQQEIQSIFVTYEVAIFTTYLIASKIDVQFDDTFLFVLTHNVDTSRQPRQTFGVIVAEFKFTPNGYQLIKHQNFLSLNLKDKPEFLHAQICGDGTPPPKHVIVPTYECNRIPFKKIFKSDNLILMNEPAQDFHKSFMIETCKWLLDKTNIKYHIMPLCSRDIHVYGYFGSKENVLDIIKIDTNDSLPFSKTAVHSRSLPNFFKNFKENGSEYGTQGRLPPFCHASETTVTIDEENFEKITSALLFIEDFDKVLSKLNNLLPSKMPFIGFFDNLSVIAAYKESKNGYEFLEEWNGVYGIDCFISFDEKKPKFGEKAMEVMLTKNTFVVFDLLKIMSMPSDDIQIQRTWGFKITKDKNNPVLLQFDNFDGTRKEASPAFLMALFLRQQLKAIQESNKNGGEKPKEIAFWIPKQTFDDKEYQRIQDGIAKACELLQLGFRILDSEIINFVYTMRPYSNFESMLFGRK